MEAFADVFLGFKMSAEEDEEEMSKITWTRANHLSGKVSKFSLYGFLCNFMVFRFLKTFSQFLKITQGAVLKSPMFFCRPGIPVKAYLWLPIFVIFRNINSFSVISKSSLFGCSWCWVVLPGVTCRSLFKNLASYVTEVI